jgi:hypothetical protein
MERKVMNSIKEVFELTYKLAKALERKFGAKIKVRLEDDMVMVDDWIDICPCDIDVETIDNENFVKNGWIVEVAHMVYNYPSEPDDVDIVEVGRFESVWGAITKVFKVWFENEIDLLIEGICPPYEEMIGKED